jgi:dTDP-4-amino-4,6-dideoxygalactose transaminase
MSLPTRQVPFFNYPHVFLANEQDLTEAITSVARRGAFILQQELADFERHLAEYTGAKHALGVANGTDALLIALRAAGVGAGDEVIFCTHTYVATAAAIHFAGATPVPVNCGPDHMLDPAAAEAAVTSHTRAIMPTQLNGRTCDMDAIQAIADRHNLLIIEDAAQALGSKFNGKCAGTFGAAGTISFYPAKTLGSFGDAGAILTNDDALFDKMFQMRDHGRNQDGEVVSWGLNSRLDNIQAAILEIKLRDYEADVCRRREIAWLYDRQLSAVEGLKLPPPPDSDAHHFDVFQNYEIEAEGRDQLKSHLAARGVGTLVQWGGKVVHQFEGLGLAAHLPDTEQMISKSLLLPMNTSLSNDDVTYVCDQVTGFYGHVAGSGSEAA